MKLNDILARDPFIVPYNGVYYMYRSNINDRYNLCEKARCWEYFKSKDLENWEGPFTGFLPDEDFWGVKEFWAPEVHEYNGKFYLLGSAKGETRHRGTAIYQADTPEGPFKMWSDGALTPEEWTSIDGTLYIDPNGTPYMVFVHEWWQVCDGEIQAIELSRDLKRTVSEPVLLFTAHRAEWVQKSICNKVPGINYGYITDGPFFYRLSNGRLCMLWSSFSKTGYAEAVAYSESGGIFGPWSHPKEPIFAGDGGHGMLFTDFSGKLRMVMHYPNTNEAHPILFDAYEENGELKICNRID